ncbi:MAG: hypothetical protein QM690_00400 [Sphingobium sp.]
MKYLLVPFIALGIGSAAFAATGTTSYPPCSKSVQDECISAAPAKHAAAKPAKAHVHHAAAHKAKGKAEKTAKS